MANALGFAPVCGTNLTSDIHVSLVRRSSNSEFDHPVAQTVTTPAKTGNFPSGGRVAILQPMISDYRVAFYLALEEELRRSGIQLEVFASDPLSETFLQNGIDDLPFAHRLPRRSVLGKGYWQGYHSFSGYDLVLIQQELRALSNYPVILNRLLRRRPRRVALWGHGTNLMANDEPGIDRSLRDWLIRKADHYFAYTDLSRDIFVKRGAESANVTVVNNSIDVSDVVSVRENVSPEWRDREREKLGLGKGPVAIFCGRLTKKKNMPFLVQAFRLAHQRLPDLSLVIVGDGEMRGWMTQETQGDSWIKLVGPRRGREKAQTLCLADAMCMPFDLGLSILDGFAAGLPVIVARGARHNPEIAYLKHDFNGLFSDLTAESYAEAIVDVLSDPDRRARMSRAAIDSAATHTLDAMVQNVSEGIQTALTAHL